jgi:hypothetical protein
MEGSQAKQDVKLKEDRVQTKKKQPAWFEHGRKSQRKGQFHNTYSGLNHPGRLPQTFGGL